MGRAGLDRPTRVAGRDARPAFPVFVGSLWLQADRAILDGRYAPPGGRLGRAADALLLGICRGSPWGQYSSP